MKYPLLYLVTGAYTCGIMAAASFHLPLLVTAVFTGLTVFLAFIPTPVLPVLFDASSLGVVWARLVTWPGKFARITRSTALLAAFFGFGALVTAWQLLPPPDLEKVLREFERGAPRKILGVVVKPPEAKGERKYLVVRALRIQGLSARVPPKMGLIRVTIPSFAEWPAIDYGERMMFRAVLQRPPDAENPGEFSFRRSLAREDIYTVAYLREPGELQALGVSHPSRLIYLATLVKKRLEQVFDQTLPPGPAGVLKVLVFGDREGLPERVEQDFKDAGVVHVLSVSGLHLGFVAMLLLAACKLLRLKKTASALVAATGVLAYAFLTGWHPPAVRAAIMWAAGVGATLAGRKTEVLAALVLAAAGILVLNPLAFFDVGFQLSFAATWGIVALTPGLLALGSPAGRGSFTGHSSGGWRNLARWLIQALRASVAISAAAQLATLPLAAYYFNRVSVVAVLANLFLAPLSGVIVQVGLVAGVAGLIWLPLAGLWQASNAVFIAVFVKLATLFGRMPGSALDVATPPVWLCVLYYAGLVLAVYGLQRVAVPWHTGAWQFRRFKQVFLLAVAGLVAVALWWQVWEVASPELRVTFLNVGQGDAIHLRLPGGFQLLVDGGGRPGPAGAGGGYDVGEKVVVPYLRRLGVRRLDMVLVTHRHADHVQGLIQVLDALPVKELMEGVGTPGTNVNGQRGYGTSSAPGASSFPRDLREGGDLHRREDESEDESGDYASYDRLMETAAKHGVRIRQVAAGQVFVFGKRTRLEILHPGQAWSINSPSRAGTTNSRPEVAENDRSLVTRLSYGRFRLLLTGDLELAGRPGLLGNHGDLRVTVLKVPHHGSRDALSPEFLDRTRPRVAVITVGRNNFGHPAPETLSLLQREEVRVYRTDQNGAVIVQTDGRCYLLRTMRKGVPQ